MSVKLKSLTIIQVHHIWTWAVIGNSIMITLFQLEKQRVQKG